MAETKHIDYDSAYMLTLGVDFDSQFIYELKEEYNYFCDVDCAVIYTTDDKMLILHSLNYASIEKPDELQSNTYYLVLPYKTSRPRFEEIDDMIFINLSEDANLGQLESTLEANHGKIQLPASLSSNTVFADLAKDTYFAKEGTKVFNTVEEALGAYPTFSMDDIEPLTKKLFVANDRWAEQKQRASILDGMWSIVGWPKSASDKESPTTGHDDFRSNVDNVYKVMKVCEWDGIARLAVIGPTKSGVSYYYTSYITYYHILSLPGDGIYDYLDVNRLLVLSTNKTKITGVFDNDVVIGDLDQGAVDGKKLENYCDSKKTLQIIAKKDFVKYRDLTVMVKNQKAQIVEKARHKLEEVSEGKVYTSGGLRLEENSFEYDGTKVVLDDVFKSSYHSYLARSARVAANSINKDIAATLNFNSLFDEIVATARSLPDLWRRDGVDRATTLKVGDVDIVISAKYTKNMSRSFRINGKRINQDELSQCISRALCHTEQSTYDDLIMMVSKCSLAIYELLDGGLDVPVSISNDTVLVKFTFRRKGNKNYLVIKDRLIKIKNLKSFGNKMKNTGWGYAHSFRNFVHKFSSIHFDEDHLTPKLIQDVIEDGKAAYEKALKRSQDLLDSAVKSTGATVLKKQQYCNKHVDLGYVLESNSGNTYLVTEDEGDAHTSECGVYIKKGDTLQYICIVDKSLGKQVGKDKIVNRLYALKSDDKTVNYISTLKGHVDQNGKH